MPLMSFIKISILATSSWIEYWRCQNDWFWDYHPIQPHQSNLQKSPSSGRNPRLSVARANRADEPYARLPQRFLLAGRNILRTLTGRLPFPTRDILELVHILPNRLFPAGSECKDSQTCFRHDFETDGEKCGGSLSECLGHQSRFRTLRPATGRNWSNWQHPLSLQDVSSSFTSSKTVWTRGGGLLAAFDRVAGRIKKILNSKLKWCWSLVTLELANQHWCRNSTNHHS